MRRLVYAPKVFAYVKTDNHGVVNLSDYVVSGNINRIVDGVSSAELTIRNPDMKWTKGARKGSPVFRPMDPITIWLQRIREHPVQVFTGYLDRTPWLQLYPGPCVLSASCTLKRLQYTFWDPALPFVINFMGMYGWEVDSKNGMLKNTPAEEKALEPVGPGKDDPQLTDGSIGTLLFGVLKHVGDWKPNQILIDKLPEGLIKMVAEIYTAYAEDSKEVEQNVTDFIKRYIDAGGNIPNVGSSNGGGSSGSNDSGKVFYVGDSLGVGTTPQLKVSGVTSDVKGSRNSTQALAILKSRLKNTHGVIIFDLGTNDPTAGVLENNIKEVLRLAGNRTVIMATVNGPRASAKNRVIERSNVTIVDWSSAPSKYLSGDKIHATPDGYKYRAKLFRNVIENLRDDSPRSDRATDPDATASQTRTGGSLRTNSDSGAQNTKLKPISMSLPGNTYESRDGTPKIIVLHSTEGHNRAGTSDLSQLADILKKQGLSVHVGNDAEGNCARYVGDDKKAFHCKDFNNAALGIEQIGFAAQKSWPDKQVENTAKWVAHWAKKYDIPLKRSTTSGVCTHQDLGSGGGGHTDPGAAFPFQKVLTLAGSFSGIEVEEDGNDKTSGPVESGITTDEMLSVAKATAFVQQMEFPGIMEAAEAKTLTGPKSLMNDKPLLPFVQQLSGAAMRSFQSLPDGRFYAFYPDYFGNMGKSSPYWNIDNVEILDAGIDLSDDALATHVFAVGDTSFGGIPEYNRMTSTGIVNIYNAAQSGLSPGAFKSEEEREKAKGRILKDPAQVLNFLKKYGARPAVEDFPMIRSHFFETFMAYHTFQLMWSRQFLTEFTFTFMPELFPGGLVGFPEHGVQCYIDQVTHEFDYEQGFQTTASLSAPATLTTSKVDSDPMQFGMVRAATES